ncbi:MAG: UDP-N-acetylmuramoyl-L-alanine--D-glutamate ligase, partial [Chloroflexi bacterium]|nr:UDP-N-acetylmuramoyl-L-alanine--D-glutamate ligase [Chloroflexota bacterium]
EDTGAWDLHPSVRGKLISFGVQAPDASSTGTFLQDDQLCINDHGQVQPLCKIDCIHLAGIHNIMNALAASAIAFAAGFPSETIRAGIDRVKGIPHRLEFVRRWHGADWYNDSIATAPERTMAAIHSFEQPLVLLLGGRDKKLPWEELAAEIHQRARHIVLFGEAADMIENILTGYEQGQLPYTLEKYASMPEAVQAVANIVKKGDVVLLSPGCTSYDAYKDFEERGDLFKQIVESFA